MADERPEDQLDPACPPAEEDASTLSGLTLRGVKLIGRTARLASSAACETAAGISTIAAGAARTLAAPPKMAVAKAKLRRQLWKLSRDVAEMKAAIECLHVKIGRRVCALERSGKIDATQDSQLEALVVSVREAEQKMDVAEADRLRLSSTPSDSTEPESGAEGKALQEEDLAEGIRLAVSRSDEGLSLPEIGAQLSMPWQRLTQVARELVKKKVLRKEGNQYRSV